MGKPELEKDPRFATNKDRLKNVIELDLIMEEWIGERTLVEVMKTLRQNSVPVGPVMDVSDIISNPHAMARNMVVEVTDDDGSTLSMEGVFPKMSRSPGKLHNAGREIGADNYNILKERLGLSEDELENLKNKKII